MQIFTPYMVIEDSSTCLHLKENKFRKGFFFFILRIFPFIHLLFTVGLIVTFGSEIPREAGIVLIAVSIIIVTLLLTRRYVTDVSITRYGADLTNNRFFREVTESIGITEVEYIFCKMRGGKGGGLFYSFVLKGSNKKKRLFTIPVVYMSNEKKIEISKKLQTVTGLEVQSDR